MVVEFCNGRRGKNSIRGVVDDVDRIRVRDVSSFVSEEKNDQSN